MAGGRSRAVLRAEDGPAKDQSENGPGPRSRDGDLCQKLAHDRLGTGLICKRRRNIPERVSLRTNCSGSLPYPRLDPKAIIKGLGGRDYSRGGEELPTPHPPSLRLESGAQCWWE